ncbi:SMODS domain-containing nucleotidyltransferase [Pseudomonas aeruginosa]|uniref:SMODS domain-containing nucleotidyltransferase n=5 Tax=Pseudomonas TaxID=286 RepID=UPI0022EB8C04|nr:nucleotidyltransferase [Pseudomonas aeruginosa]MDA3347797.1 nucleotidyltransferase [Pseudomonas aeruginosa]
MSADLFSVFRSNLAVKNADEISVSYKKITKKLNEKYYDSESEFLHCRQVGSYGRRTAVDGVSDLDMAFLLPWDVYHRFNNYANNKQSALLGEIRKELSDLYPNKTVRAQQQVVSVDFGTYVVEVLPAFENEDGSYTYPDANDGRSWEDCNPIAEIEEVDELHKSTNSNLKRLCKMVRAWKNDHGVAMKGMLIDTLCHNFFKQTDDYDDATYKHYKNLVKDFFAFLVDQDEDQEYWLAPGSKSRVYKTGNFHAKAKKALRRCTEALEDEAVAHERWKTVFGVHFPDVENEEERQQAYKEEFINEKFSLDIKYSLKIDYSVESVGESLRALMSRVIDYRLPKEKKLTFYIVSDNVEPPYKIYWKVRNTGREAVKRKMQRGNIVIDSGARQITETSNFDGDHFVECYAVKNGVCVARGRVYVPI